MGEFKFFWSSRCRHYGVKSSHLASPSQLLKAQIKHSSPLVAEPTKQTLLTNASVLTAFFLIEMCSNVEV